MLPSVRVLIVVLTGAIVFSGQASAQSSDEFKGCRDSVATHADSVIRVCTEAIESGKLRIRDLAHVYDYRGNAYAFKTEFELAIHDYDSAIKLLPGDTLALYSRGSAYWWSRHDVARALSDIDEAIRLNPSISAAYSMRGLIDVFMGKYDRAIEDHDRAIRLNPRSAAAIAYRGEAYLAREEYERSIQDFTEAIRLDQGYRFAPYGKGVAEFCLGQFELARNDFEAALRIKQDFPYDALWLYLATLRSKSNPEEDPKKLLAGQSTEGWPGTIVRFYLGTTTTDSLLEGAASPDLGQSQSRLCEAFFFFGERTLIAGDRVQAATLFQKAIDNGNPSKSEHLAAQEELRRLKSPTNP